MALSSKARQSKKINGIYLAISFLYIKKTIVKAVIIVYEKKRKGASKKVKRPDGQPERKVKMP
jgi:hypothetical protein